MSTILSIIGFLLLAVILVIGFAGLIVLLKYLSWFHWRSCKHCGHDMEYKGIHDDEENGHYLFRCPKCGSWEKIAREEFIRNCDADCNPNV